MTIRKKCISHLFITNIIDIFIGNVIYYYIDCECLPFPAREDETGGLGLPVPSEIIKLKYIIFQLILVVSRCIIVN